MIDEKLIFTGLEYTEKTSLLNFCYKKLKELDYIWDISEFADEIKKKRRNYANIRWLWSSDSSW